MKAIEIDEMLHSIREEHAAELEGLSPEEKLRLDKELFDRDIEELGLRRVKLADRLIK